jgi:subtilisin family serine protease
LAEEIAAIYGLIVIDTVDVPGYKAIIVQAPVANNPVFSDTRFVDYNTADVSGVGEMNDVSGHYTQLKWNQTIPDGVKRTIPIANGTGEDENISSSTPRTVNNTAPTGVAEFDNVGPIKQAGSSTSGDVDIAILDTGISLNHPDLNVYRNVSFVEGITSGNDPVGHGSHVAGVAAAKDNSLGIVGVAPGARLWAIKVCDNSGECKISDQIKGIEYAIKHANEIDVLNISIENPNSPALNNIISAAVKAGITVVVSAGNYGQDASTTTPANNPNVITVSAIGDSDGKCGGLGPVLPQFDGSVPDDTFAFFSNFGPAVKVAAPGVNVFSTYNGTGYAVDSGTSMAAPFVTGAAALYKSEFPNASPDEVIANVTASGSLPTTVCDGGAHGYFAGDLDKINEPLLFRESVPKR